MSEKFEDQFPPADYCYDGFCEVPSCTTEGDDGLTYEERKDMAEKYWAAMKKPLSPAEKKARMNFVRSKFPSK